MARQQRITIDLSVKILRQAMTAKRASDVEAEPVRLALRCLMPHCPERWPLLQFWEGWLGTHEIGHAQSMTAAFNGIIRQLRRSGAWRDSEEWP